MGWAYGQSTRISGYRAKIYKIASEVFRFQVLLIPKLSDSLVPQRAKESIQTRESKRRAGVA